MVIMKKMKTFKEIFTILGKGTHLNGKGILEQGIERDKGADREKIISGVMRSMTAEEMRGITGRGISSN